MTSPHEAPNVTNLLTDLESAIRNYLDWLSALHRRVIGGSDVAGGSDASQHLVAVAMRCRDHGFGERATVDELAVLGESVRQQTTALVTQTPGKGIGTEAYGVLMETAERFLAIAQRLVSGLHGASAELDPRTGLSTRDAMVRDLEREHARVSRLGRSSCLALIAFIPRGVGSANESLALASQCVVQNLRAYDAVYLFDDITLALFLPDTPLDAAGRILERIHARIESEVAAERQTSSDGVRCAIGVAPIDRGAPADHSVNRASVALVRASSQTREGVSVWSDTLTTA